MGKLLFDYEEMKNIRTEITTVLTEIEDIKKTCINLQKTSANEWNSKEVTMFDTLMTHADKGIKTIHTDFGTILNWNAKTAEALGDLEDAISSSLAKAYSSLFGK